MRLSENRVRQIIRREARRVLREAFDDAGEAPSVPSKFRFGEPTHTIEVYAKTEREAERVADELDRRTADRQSYKGWRVRRHPDDRSAARPSLEDDYYFILFEGPGGGGKAMSIARGIYEEFNLPKFPEVVPYVG